MKSILQINAYVNCCSTGRIAEQIGVCASQAGLNSCIAWGRKAMPSQSSLLKVGNRLDIIWHGIETRLFDRQGLASRHATENFVKKIQALKPDLIQLHSICNYYVNYEILFEYLAKADIPVVWTMHDCWAFTGHCYHFDFVGCDKWMGGCHHCPQKKEFPASYFFDRSRQNWLDKKRCFTMPNRMTIVAVSRWLQKQIQKSFLAKYPIELIYNGVDTEVFKPCPVQVKEKYNWQNRKILLGVASTWSLRKGLGDYIELSKILPNDFLIILVGLTSKQACGLPTNIISIPCTESVSTLAELYSMADVVLNLSYEETFGLTSVEGFACGTPGVVYDKTASPELLDGDTGGVGMVVAAGDIAGVKDAVINITSKDKSVYSEQCRQHVLTHFRASDCFQKYINLYDRILNKT